MDDLVQYVDAFLAELVRACFILGPCVRLPRGHLNHLALVLQKLSPAPRAKRARADCTSGTRTPPPPSSVVVWCVNPPSPRAQEQCNPGEAIGKLRSLSERSQALQSRVICILLSLVLTASNASVGDDERGATLEGLSSPLPDASLPTLLAANLSGEPAPGDGAGSPQVGIPCSRPLPHRGG